MSSLSPGLYFGSRHYIVPLTTDAGYIPIIKSICFRERIHLLIPTIDDELPLFGRHTYEFWATGIRVAVSSEQPTWSAMTRDRRISSARGFLCPLAARCVIFRLNIVVSI
jgi:hypothetical protein